VSGDPYDPGADMLARYPGWVVRWRRIAPVPEVLCVRRRVVLVDRDGDSPTRRCALAHAVAHIDLGHLPDSGRQGRRYEGEADLLAAQRLIGLERLGGVLTWALGPDEVAAELDVTEHMVSVRVRGLSPLEKQTIEQIVERTEGAA